MVPLSGAIVVELIDEGMAVQEMPEHNDDTRYDLRNTRSVKQGTTNHYAKERQCCKELDATMEQSKQSK